MLTPGNDKLGQQQRIWAFGLPSRQTCPGCSPVCAHVCYSAHLERRRPSVHLHYLRNLLVSQRADFGPRLLRFLASHQVKVVRIHSAGDFYSPAYARQWLAIIRRAPAVRFYAYTRSWRVSAIQLVLVALAKQSNLRLWFSCDRSTGLPRCLPPRVGLAWLMARPEDLPPAADLVFRTSPLRTRVQKYVSWERRAGRALVCPVENGVTGPRTTCSQCGLCWRALPQPGPQSLSRAGG